MPHPNRKVKMKTLFKAAVILSLSFGSTSTCLALDSQVMASETLSLNDIKNFRALSPIFASAGMPESTAFALLKQGNYQHVINLIPGDFSEEQQQLSTLGMSFEQIEVDWHEPKLSDFQTFVKLMNKHQQDKVLVHCRLNYRASAFAYLYQTTQLGMDEAIAKRQLLSVWQPEGTWLAYIEMIQQHYQAK